MQVPIESTDPVINPLDTSIGTGTYTIIIKHPNHGIATTTRSVVFIGFIEHNGISANNLNGKQTINVLDSNRYEFILTNINLSSIKNTTYGGRGVIVEVPSRIKFYFNYEDTMGHILGFRNVGYNNSITDFSSIIKNSDPYLNDINYDFNGNPKIMQQDVINLETFKYFYITCDELPIFNHTNN